jgi:hypothetical protein
VNARAESAVRFAMGPGFATKTRPCRASGSQTARRCKRLHFVGSTSVDGKKGVGVRAPKALSSALNLAVLSYAC